MRFRKIEAISQCLVLFSNIRSLQKDLGNCGKLVKRDIYHGYAYIMMHI